MRVTFIIDLARSCVVRHGLQLSKLPKMVKADYVWRLHSMSFFFFFFVCVCVCVCVCLCACLWVGVCVWRCTFMNGYGWDGGRGGGGAYALVCIYLYVFLGQCLDTWTGGLFVSWSLNVPATCECSSGTDLLRQFYVLPHWDRSCRPNFPSYPVTVYWHWADQSQHGSYNSRNLAG